MKAAVFEEAGRPLVVGDVPDPSPTESELVLKVKCCGICGTDLHASAVPGGLPVGCVMGHEFSGEIVEVGNRAVGGFSLGERVACVPAKGCGACAACLSGDVMQCAGLDILGLGQMPGAFAEYVRVGSQEALRLPEHIDWNSGALVEPLAVGLHAVKVAQVQAG
ncbi:MAG: alcohol dehydrogenase catalytic domain-containing protein [Myxococcota bacterium]